MDLLRRWLEKNESPIKEYKTHSTLSPILMHNSCFEKKIKMNLLFFKGFQNYTAPK